MKVSKDLSKILQDAAKEVSKWEPWRSSLDLEGERPSPTGEKGAEK